MLARGRPSKARIALSRGVGMNPQRTESSHSGPSWRTLRRWLPTVLAVGLAGPVAAQDKPIPVDPPKTVAPMPMVPAVPAKAEKTYTVAFEVR